MRLLSGQGSVQVSVMWMTLHTRVTVIFAGLWSRGYEFDIGWGLTELKGLLGISREVSAQLSAVSIVC